MTISNEAVEAAAIALGKLVWADYDHETDMDSDEHEANARAALEAAAGIIRAECLEDAADEVMGPSDVLLDGATCRWIAMELREQAAAERGRE